MSTTPRTNKPAADAPRADAAPSATTGTVDINAAEFTAPDDRTRSLEERIEAALRSLNEVLERADPFGELAAAADRARDGGNNPPAPSTATPAGTPRGPHATPEPSHHAPAPPNPPPENHDQPEPTDSSPTPEPAPRESAPDTLDAMPTPEASLDSIEALLDEAESALLDDAAPNDAAAGVDATTDPHTSAATNAEPAHDPIDNATIAGFDPDDFAAPDGLPDPSLESELAHESALESAYAADLQQDPLQIAPEGTPNAIAPDLEALAASEGVPIPASASAEITNAGDAEPAATTPAPDQTTTPSIDATPKPADAAPVSKTPPQATRPAAPNNEPRTEPTPGPSRRTSVSLRRRAATALGSAARLAYPLCTRISAPLALLPVSMRDPLGAIALFTLINAIVVWALVLILR